MWQRKGGKTQSWMWDYYSVKDNAIYMSVCDICSENQRHIIRTVERNNMKKHLSDHHESIVKETLDLELHFERVQCSTDDEIDSITCKIECKHCDQYDMSFRACRSTSMENHLKKKHDVTMNNWKYLRDWRNMKTKKYYKLTWRLNELAARTRGCEKCGHQFRHSNLIIMLKHLLQSHRPIPSIDLNQLPKGLVEIQLRFPTVDGLNIQCPSTFGNAVGSFQKRVSKRQ